MSKYNQILWAINGTIFLVLLILLPGVVMWKFLSQTERGAPAGVLDRKQSETTHDMSVVMCPPIIVPDSQYYMIPVAITRAEQQTSGFASISSGYNSPFDSCSGVKWGRSWEINNVIMFNTETSASSKLFKKPNMISLVEYPGKNDRLEKDDFPPPGVIYLEATGSDFNKDGVINDKDGATAYLSSMSGDSPIAITPDGTQVMNHSYDKTRHLLFIQARSDSNANGQFDQMDATHIYKVDTTAPGLGQLLISTDGIDKIQ